MKYLIKTTQTFLILYEEFELQEYPKQTQKQPKHTEEESEKQLQQ